MSIHNEIEFENEVCEHLASHGWLYAEQDAADYDRKLALFPADVVAWVQQAYPDAWETIAKNHGKGAADTLCSRLRDSLGKSGALIVIHQGFDLLNYSRLYEDLRAQGSAM